MRHSHRAWILLSFALMLASGAASHVARAATPIYVNDDATGANDGTSWADAYKDLQDALDAAAAGDEIWVAAGTYKPSVPAGRDASFDLAKNVKVYGSFAGTEKTLAQRSLNPVYTSILSGDIGTFESEDDVYHVVTVPAGSAPRLDGFRIRDGYANGGVDDNVGGGIRNSGTQGYFQHLWILDNFASDKGGGVYEYPGSNYYLDVLFDDNQAASGGGIAIMGGATVLRESAFLSNDAGVDGGAAFVAGFGTMAFLTNITVLGGTAAGASAFDVATTAQLFLSAASISGAHSTGSNGAVRTKEAGAKAQMTNVILWQNFGGEAKEPTGAVTISYGIVDGGCSAGVSCDHVVDQDPQFVLPGSDNGGFVPTMALLKTSPAIDAGTNSNCPSLDARHGARKFDGDGNGTAECDLGSYEYIAKPTLELLTTTDTVAEADAYLHVQMKLSHAYPQPISILIKSTGGTATLDADYKGLPPAGYVRVVEPGTKNFAAGFAIAHDALDEPDETAVFTISNPTNAVIEGPSELTTTITDDDEPPSLSFKAATSAGSEQVRKPVILVQLSTPSGRTVGFGLAATGSADPATDYTGPVTPVEILPGTTQVAVALTIRDDGTPESNETVVIAIKGVEGATIGAIATHTYTISDNDKPTKCFGRATTIYGTPGNDTIAGTAGADVIDARGGADRVRGLGGNDVICGRAGKDTLRGGPGNDRIDGSAGPDVLRGSSGDDELLGAAGNDEIFGETGRDRLAGGGGTDACNGGPGTDSLLPAHGCEAVVGVP